MSNIHSCHSKLREKGLSSVICSFMPYSYTQQFLHAKLRPRALNLGQPPRTTDDGLPPGGQRILERFHRSLKAAFRTRLLDGELLWVLLRLCTASKEAIQSSKAEHSVVARRVCSQVPRAHLPRYARSPSKATEHHRKPITPRHMCSSESTLSILCGKHMASLP